MGRRKHDLSHGRPALQKAGPARLSKRAGRSIIRSHHRLRKSLHDAEQAGDEHRTRQLQGRIDGQGGLISYQHASLLGQSSERGGDSSKVLLEWMKDRLGRTFTSSPLRVLEVGALSTSNACSRSKAYKVTRIDLNPQAPGITKQDFMLRPLPQDESERFDMVSLSLVLNFVASKEERGLMLQRTCGFLATPRQIQSHGGEGARTFKPCLFLVLPRACIMNSRYMDESRMIAMMGSIKYVLVEQKVTLKLVYQLWEYDAEFASTNLSFDKVEVKGGRDRNNFCVVLQNR